MRTTFLVSTLLVVFAAVVSIGAQTQQSVASAAGTAINYSAKNSRTRFDIHTRAGKRYTLFSRRDSTIAPTSNPTSVQVVGELKGSAIIITDTYASLPGGLSYCQAGEERFLRVISIAKKRPMETLRVKIESCRQNLELDATGIEWSAESATLRIHWLTGPTTNDVTHGPGAPLVRTIRIGPQGKPI